MITLYIAGCIVSFCIVLITLIVDIIKHNSLRITINDIILAIFIVIASWGTVCIFIGSICYMYEKLDIPIINIKFKLDNKNKSYERY